jgi:hypothetical protein
VLLRRLLWFDCTAAAVVGTAQLALLGLLAPLLGVPRGFVTFTALMNLAYGAFSFSLARTPSPALRWVKVLVVANFAWAGVCLVSAAYFARPGSWWGAIYVMTEGAFVAALAAREARAARAAGQPRGLPGRYSDTGRSS